MSWYKNLKTSSKLLVGFGAVLALLAGVGLFSMNRLAVVDEQSNVIAQSWLPSVEQVGVLRSAVSSFRVYELRHAASGDATEMAAMEKRLQQTEERITTARKKYEPLISSPEERALYDRFVKALDEYTSQHDQMLQLSRQGRNAEALELLNSESSRAAYNTAGEVADELATLNSRGAEAASAKGTAVYRAARIWIIGVLVGALLLGLALALTIGGIIARPLQEAVRVLGLVAEGDFTQSLQVDTRDEVGQMAQALNRTVSRMRQALAEVRTSADSTASASQQLQAASEEISSGAQEQASSLEETAASLEEMTATIKQNADNARQANQLAASAREVAEKGSAVVGDAVRAMGEINTASKQIADIITTIDEIAFQTNLLALNAAVEAARAGQQGRGFAVVAGEVRKLAGRSATAAKEIKSLIQDSTRKVESGAELVSQSGQSLQEIVGSVKRVTDIVAEIAAASREQATGIDQVNRAVTQMDQVTQANAGQTEELASTAESLAAQAEQLQASVARFKLDDDEGFGRSTARSAPRPAARKVAKVPVNRVAALTRSNGNGHGHVPVEMSPVLLDAEDDVVGLDDAFVKY